MNVEKYKYSCKLLRLHVHVFYKSLGLSLDLLKSSEWDIEGILKCRFEKITTSKVLSNDNILAMNKLFDKWYELAANIFSGESLMFKLMERWTDMTRKKWTVTCNTSLIREMMNNDKYAGISPVFMFDVCYEAHRRYGDDVDKRLQITDEFMDSHMKKINKIICGTKINCNRIYDEHCSSIKNTDLVRESSNDLVNNLVSTIVLSCRNLVKLYVVNYLDAIFDEISVSDIHCIGLVKKYFSGGDCEINDAIIVI